ncbi:MAG: hypothetical protein WDW36_002371 [Sanguina aurantia]
MGSRDDLVAFFRSYSFQDDEAWLRIRRGMPSVTSDQALDRMKAIYIRDNMSIMGVMMLAAGLGTALTIRADGPDEQSAVTAVADLFERKFDEGA